MKEQRSYPRTHYIHRISYTTQERMVGTFVLVAVFILVGLLLSSGKNKNLFEEYITIYGELQTVQAINEDTQVTISGLSAGSVSSVDITDDNKVILTMKILKKYHNLLREDSQAKLSSFNFAVVQKSVIEISTGSRDKALLKDGSTLQVSEAFNIKDLMGKIEPIFLTLEDSILKMNAILSEIDPKQLGETLGDMNAIMNNIEEISAHMRSGQGLIGQSLYDKEFQNSITTTTINMEQASIKINLLLNDIKHQVDNVPELLEKIGPLLNEADKTIKGAQNVWPLSSAVEKEENKETLVSPEPAND
jgi:phospholipid/cholesterol/gamma-HCH transport system substrate-binding protein